MTITVYVEETSERAEADTPEDAVYAGARLLEGARAAGIKVPHAHFVVNGVLVRAGVTRTEIAATLGRGICWCGRGGLYRKDGRPFCCAKHEVLWDEWSDDLRARTIAAQFIAIYGRGGKRTYAPDPKSKPKPTPKQAPPTKPARTKKKSTQRKGKRGKGTNRSD